MNKVFKQSLGGADWWVMVIFLALLSILPLSLGHGASPRSEGSAGVRTERSLPGPSVNQGRRGIYACKTSKPGYNYYLYVPRKYAESNPAGLHLFFHGMGGQSMAKTSFSLWASTFLEPFNLIGINMEYSDGNPHKDGEGKADAAFEAVQQTIADYRIMAGRGVMLVFSAGGTPGGIYFAKHGRSAKRLDRGWPFNQVGVLGSCLRTSSESTEAPVTFFRAMGEGEEKMAPGLLSYMMERTVANLQAGCGDVFFNYTKGKGHTILPQDLRRSAEVFARSDLAHAPFIFEPDFSEPEVSAIVEQANGRKLGAGYLGIERLLKNTSASPMGKQKASLVRSLIDQQIHRMLKMISDLSTTDPALFFYYSTMFLRQLEGHPRQAELKSFVGGLGPKSELGGSLLSLWTSNLKSVFDFKTAGVKAEKISFLKEMKQKAGTDSQIALMVDRFLDFAPGGPGDKPAGSTAPKR